MGPAEGGACLSPANRLAAIAEPAAASVHQSAERAGRLALAFSFGVISPDVGPSGTIVQEFTEYQQ
jgi:hypothetical protein